MAARSRRHAPPIALGRDRLPFSNSECVDFPPLPALALTANRFGHGIARALDAY